MNLKLSAFEKGLIEEISIFSGYSQSIIREVLEFIFIRQIEQFLSTKKINIPFIGEANINYDGDIMKEGCKEAQLSLTVISSAILKRVIGEAVDGNNDLIRDLLEQKIPSAISNILLEE